jgi:hypothetical protein
VTPTTPDPLVAPAEGDRLSAATRKIRSTLDDVAEALARADLAQLEVIEAALAEAAAGLAEVASLSGARPAADVRAELRLARESLNRCRRLGASLDDFARLSGQARGVGGEYSRQGRPRPVDHAGRVETRI